MHTFTRATGVISDDPQLCAFFEILRVTSWEANLQHIVPANSETGDTCVSRWSWHNTQWMLMSRNKLRRRRIGAGGEPVAAQALLEFLRCITICPRGGPPEMMAVLAPLVLILPGLAQLINHMTISRGDASFSTGYLQDPSHQGRAFDSSGDGPLQSLSISESDSVKDRKFGPGTAAGAAFISRLACLTVLLVSSRGAEYVGLVSRSGPMTFGENEVVHQMLLLPHLKSGRCTGFGDFVWVECFDLVARGSCDAPLSCRPSSRPKPLRAHLSRAGGGRSRVGATRTGTSRRTPTMATLECGSAGATFLIRDRGSRRRCRWGARV